MNGTDYFFFALFFGRGIACLQEFRFGISRLMRETPNPGPQHDAVTVTLTSLAIICLVVNTTSEKRSDASAVYFLLTVVDKFRWTRRLLEDGGL